MPAVSKAQERRLAYLLACENDPAARESWIKVMVTDILKTKCEYFRWHDSGDLQGPWHGEMIAEVARRTPEVRHWLPTKQYLDTKLVEWPTNIVVRKSSYMVDRGPAPNAKGLWNMVYTDPANVPPDAYLCPAYEQGGKCGDCRACWDPGVRVVALPKH